MGADKALSPLAGKPLVAHALATLRAAGLAAAIAGARVPLEAYAPVVEDAEPDGGPLSGICAALKSTSARWAVFLPVDLPLLPASLVVFLLHRARISGAAVTVAEVNGFPQTFPAVLDRAVLAPLEVEFRAGRSGCFSGFQAASAALDRPLVVLPVEMLVQSGHVAHPEALLAARWFLNVNAPADLATATTVRGAQNPLSIG
jgi:molybdopterin-guanine dinucleotide biosynthesis protein A